jgi:hypothetical protein
MSTTKELRRALEVLTEGGDAPMLESLKPKAAMVQKESRSWTTGKGIQGLGIGQKMTDATRRKDLVLKVYVEEKLPKSKCKNLVPSKVRIPGISSQLATDVESIGKVEIEPNTSRVRPAIPGFSIGHLKITAGTLGCLVTLDSDKNGLYVLSNSHVLANSGLGKKGDVIVQPGPTDGGKAPKDVIAKLSDWIPFQFTSGTFPNLVDAAIAKVKNKKEVTSVIRKIGVPKGTSTTLRRGMKVKKTGRTTDFTHGEIVDVDYRLQISYSKPGGGKGRVGFRDQVLCTRYTAGGDSGSAVLNSKDFVVGLHFAGSPSSSIFNRIANVTKLLNVCVVTKKI